MSEKLTQKQIDSNWKAQELLNDEGVDYALMYCSMDFLDPTTEKLWGEAKAALIALTEHISETTK